MTMKREHWETDQWDDHPAGLTDGKSPFGLTYIALKGSTATAQTDPNAARGLAAAAGSNAGLTTAQIQAAMTHAAALTSAGVDSTTAAKTAVAAQQGHLNFLQKLLHFIAHPIKTTRAALHPQSAMHGMHGGMPNTSRFGAPVNVQTGKAWYENQYDSTDWSR